MSLLAVIGEKIISVTASAIVLIAMHYPPLLDYLIETAPYVPPQPHVITMQKDDSVAQNPAVSKPFYVDQSADIMPVFSSSTVRVGDYSVQVDCKDLNPEDITITKNGEVVQTIGVHALLTGVKSCTKVISEDVNFDGHQDFLLLTGTGSGGAMVTYWLYTPETREFSCPNDSNTESSDVCVLSNPKFDSTTKTITTRHAMGAGRAIINVYRATDGTLKLLSHTEQGF